jgi:hypothetical protein
MRERLRQKKRNNAGTVVDCIPTVSFVTVILAVFQKSGLQLGLTNILHTYMTRKYENITRDIKFMTEIWNEMCIPYV